MFFIISSLYNIIYIVALEDGNEELIDYYRSLGVELAPVESDVTDFPDFEMNDNLEDDDEVSGST